MNSALQLPRDIRDFLDGYPDSIDDRELQANTAFYSNTKRCRPDNALIGEIHERSELSFFRMTEFV